MLLRESERMAIKMKNHILIICFLIIFTSSTMLFSQTYWSKTNLSDIFVSMISTGKSGALYAGTSEGIFQSLDKGYRWEKIGEFQRTIYCVLENDQGTIFVGTNDGIFRRKTATSNWEQIDTGLASNWIFSLTATEDGAVYAGAYFDGGLETGGVYVSTDEGTNWIKTGLENKNINNLSVRWGKSLYAATDLGIFEFSNSSWFEIAPQWTDSGRVANTILFDNYGDLIVGANDGIYYIHQDGFYWRKMPTYWTNQNIQSIAMNSVGHLFVANSREIYCTIDEGMSWFSLNLGYSDSTYINSLNINENDFLFAATFNGVFRTIESTLPKISLEIPHTIAYIGHEVKIPIIVEIPWSFSYGSFEIQMSNPYEGTLDFLGIETDSSILNTSDWMVESFTDTTIRIAGAGSYDLGGSGILCWLRFNVSATTPETLPLYFEHASFCECNDVYIEFQGNEIEIREWFDGDVSEDGQVHAHDASLILKYLLGRNYLSPIQKELANVSGDSTVSALDASLVLQYVVGMVNSLPYSTGTQFANAGGSFNLISRAINSENKVEVPIYAQDITNIFSFEADLSYNPNQLKLSKINYSDEAKQFFKEENVDAGQIKLVGSSTIAYESDGILAILEFEVIDYSDLMISEINIDKLRLNEEQPQKNISSAVVARETRVEKNTLEAQQQFKLSQNYPNPFNPSTIIRYQLPKAGPVKLTIFNVKGQIVKEVFHKYHEAGMYSYSWDASQLGAGIYFYELRTENFVERKKSILVK